MLTGGQDRFDGNTTEKELGDGRQCQETLEEALA